MCYGRVPGETRAASRPRPSSGGTVNYWTRCCAISSSHHHLWRGRRRREPPTKCGVRTLAYGPSYACQCQWFGTGRLARSQQVDHASRDVALYHHGQIVDIVVVQVRALPCRTSSLGRKCPRSLLMFFFLLERKQWTRRFGAADAARRIVFLLLFLLLCSFLSELLAT
jgi:hypothetical protein